MSEQNEAMETGTFHLLFIIQMVAFEAKSNKQVRQHPIKAGFQG